MPELYIFSPDDELLTILTENNGLTHAPFRDELNNVSETPFSFTIDAQVIYEHAYNKDNNLTQVAGMLIGTMSNFTVYEKVNVSPAQFVKEENRVVFKDREGRFREFVIKELDDRDNVDGPETTAYCLPAWIDELSEHYVLDKRYANKTAQLALNDALDGTRYVGEVQGEFGVASTNFYRLSSVGCIWNIRDTWGGDITDEIVLNEQGRIATRKIVLKMRLGADNGLRFEIDHNIEEIQRTILSYPKTAMYGYGASLETDGGGYTRYIDFGNVEWKVSNGDPVNKPKGQKWVGDPDALQSLGRLKDGQRIHRYGEYYNHVIEDPEELLWVTWNHLQEAKKPVVHYRLQADLLDKRAALGDTAIAIDREFARPIEIQSRIIAIEYDLLDVESTTILEFGQFLNLQDDRLDQVVEDINKNRGKWEHPEIGETNYPDTKPSTPLNVEAIGGYKTIQLYWDYADEIFIKHYEVYGSQVADFVPDSQHLLWRGQVSAFAHTANTDEVWYYRVRAVNYHGTVSDWSNQVSASTQRVLTDDLLFGPEMAERLRELHELSDIIGENGVDLENLTQHAKDMLKQQARDYTDAEIETTRNALLEDIASKAGLEYVNGQLQAKVDYEDYNQTVMTLIETDNSLRRTIQETNVRVDNIDVSGTNFITHLPDHWEQDTPNSIQLKELYPIDPNKDYTITRFLEVTAIDVLLYDINENPTRTIALTDEWLTFQTQSNEQFFSVVIKGQSITPSDMSVTLRAKLSLGTETSGWTPNVNDTGQLIADVQEYVSEFEQTSKSLRSDISALEMRVENDIVTQLSNHESLFEQHANQINLKVSQDEFDSLTGSLSQSIASLDIKADGIISTVESIQIGGRNLLKNSDFSNGSTHWSLAGGWTLDTGRTFRGMATAKLNQRSGTWRRILSDPAHCEPEEVYTLSFWYYVPSGEDMGTGIRVIIEYLNGDGVTQQIEDIPHDITGQWLYMSITKKGFSDSVQVRARFDARNAGSFWIALPKLEKGNKATDWTPAPEDMEQEMSIMSSEITQLAGRIDLKVDVDGIISAINLSKEGARITGNLIHLDGLTLIDEGIIQTAHIANAAIKKAHLQQAIIDDVHINNMSGTKIIAKTIGVDQLNVSTLSGITADLGTVTAGILRSKNNNMDLNLNTGALRMQNANLTIANGASINFEDPGNTLTYRKRDATDGITRSAGLGVGDRTGGRYPFAYLGATGASNLNSLSQYFSGFIANSTAAIGEDAANSVNGWRFQMRSTAVSWEKGLDFDFNGNPTIRPINGHQYNYSLGNHEFMFDTLHVRRLYTVGGFDIFNNAQTGVGWRLSTIKENGVAILRGLNGGSNNYQIGSSESYNRITRIYLTNQPDVTSDERLKTDISHLDLGLDFIKKVEAKQFRLKSTSADLDRNPIQYGIIAQQVNSLLADFGVLDNSLINRGGDGYYSAQYEQFIPILINSVQQMDEKFSDDIESLKLENQYLKQKIELLEAKLA